MKVYSVRDSKAESYGTPIFLPTDGLALRAFEDQVQREGSPLYDHPEDFCLFLLGTFDEHTGRLEPLEQPKSLGQAVEYVKTTN